MAVWSLYVCFFTCSWGFCNYTPANHRQTLVKLLSQLEACSPNWCWLLLLKVTSCGKFLKTESSKDLVHADFPQPQLERKLTHCVVRLGQAQLCCTPALAGSARATWKPRCSASRTCSTSLALPQLPFALRISHSQIP